MKWARFLDGFEPDRWDLIGTVGCLFGVLLIVFGPRDPWALWAAAVRYPHRCIDDSARIASQVVAADPLLPLSIVRRRVSFVSSRAWGMLAASFDSRSACARRGVAGG